MKNKFYEWYSTQVTQALDRDKEIDEIEVPLKLSLPLDAKGFIEMYSHMTEEDGRKVSMKGWEVAGIKEAVQKGLAGLPNLEPFSDIDPITRSDADFYSHAASINKIHGSSKYVRSESVYTDSESDDKWFEEHEDIHNQIRNAFDCFDDENENV